MYDPLPAPTEAVPFPNYIQSSRAWTPDQSMFPEQAAPGTAFEQGTLTTKPPKTPLAPTAPQGPIETPSQNGPGNHASSASPASPPSPNV